MSNRNSSFSRASSSTLSALLQEPRGRGRPKNAVSRVSVYVALSEKQKDLISELGSQLQHLTRADISDMSIMVFSVRLEVMRRAVAGRTHELPAGIRDVESLYLLWDLALPEEELEVKWTSVRLSPQQAIELGRLQGMLHALFGVNRSQVFSLALALISQLQAEYPVVFAQFPTLEGFDVWLRAKYL